MPKAFKILPKNYLADWGEFEDWSLGTGSSPTGWLAATSPTCARESSAVKYGSYALSLTGGASQGGIYRTIPEGANYSGRTFSLSFWAKSASTGPYIRLSDGVGESTIHLDGLNAMAEHTTPAHKLAYLASQIRVDLVCPAGVNAIFDSGVLVEGEDVFTNFDNNILIDKWNPALNMRQDSFEISGRDGQFVPETILSNRNINVSGTVVGSDADSCRSNFDTLMKSIVDWNRSNKKNMYLYEDRVIEVFLNSFNWTYKNSLKFIDFNMRLMAPEAVTRYINKFRHLQTISSATTEFSFVYNGSSDTKPIISVVADQGSIITTCQLENLTTSEKVIYSGTVPQNVALDIDCDKGTVFNSSVNKISDFGTSDFPKIVRGTNYWRFSGSNCTIKIDYYEKYL